MNKKERKKRKRRKGADTQLSETTATMTVNP